MNSQINRQSFTADQARELTDQIRTGMESVFHLIRSAYRGRAWAALGYGSWDEYVTREFGNLHLRPPLEERLQVVVSLREVGMSVRAIAAATQLSRSTVNRELTEATPTVPNGTVDTAPATEIVGVNGKTYQPTQQRGTPAENAEVLHGEGAEVLEGQSSIDDLLDRPASEAGVELLDLSSRDEQERDRGKRVLAAFNGSGSAAVPMLIKAATPLTSLVSQVTGKAAVSDEDLQSVMKDSARAVRTLAHVMSVLRRVEGDERAELQSTVRDAVDDLEKVLDKIEEVS